MDLETEVGGDGLSPKNSKMSLVGETGKGYLERDKGVKKEEDDGIIEFRSIKNDKKEENMKYLIDLK